MLKTNFTNKHLTCLSAWAGFQVNLNDDFDILVQNEFDFIEILLLFEKHFSLDLLETDKVWQEFSSIQDFVSWAMDHSQQEPIKDKEPENFHFAEHLRQRDFICQQVGA